MKKLPNGSLWVLSALVICSFAGTARAEHTRVTNPNAFSVELLGRGMLYTIQYDRVLSDDLAAGFSFGQVATKNAAGQDTNVNATLVPAYLNYYFMREAGSLFGTAGVTLVTNSSSVKGFTSSTGNLDFPSNTILPTFGAGYENRGDTGFLFRITAYGVVGKSVTPWLGFAFGYSF